MKRLQTWMISAILVFCACGLTACGDNNRNAGVEENNANKTNSADMYGNGYVNGATDKTNSDYGVVGDVLEDAGDAGEDVLDGVGDAGKAVIDGAEDVGDAVIDGAEDVGDTLTGNRNNVDESRNNTVNP